MCVLPLILQLYQHHKVMEKQAKEQAIQRMVAAGEMVPGANLALDAQNEQQVGCNKRILFSMPVR